MSGRGGMKTSVFSVETRRTYGIWAAALMMGCAAGEVRAQSSAGACCLPNGTCTVANDPFVCQAQSGVFLGTFNTCAGVVCTGACCLPNKSCSQTGTAGCTAAGGVYQGRGSVCGEDCPSALSMAFTYQGQLKREGVPLTGVIDGHFSLWTSESSDDLAHRVGLLQVNSIEVVNGLFQAELNFGQDAFNGNARWLQIEVHDHDDAPGTFTLLSPRQTITPTPYSLQTRGIVVRENGNVGIGTKTPTSKVEIVAHDGLALTGFQPFVTLRDTNSNQGSIIQGADGKIIFLSSIGGTPAMVINTGTGNVGIGTADSQFVKLQAVGGSDTAPGGGGFIVAGSNSSVNISIDDNEIMARNNGQTSTLLLNNDGGDVKVGGAIDIGIEDIQMEVDGTELTLACPAGKRALSGGCFCGAAGIQISRYSGTGWHCRCEGQVLGDERVIVYVRCARVK